MQILNDGYIQVYYGDEKAKTTAAIGQGVCAVAKEKKVIMIQFLNEFDNYDAISLKKLEPDFKVFSFVKKKKSEQNFCYIDELKTQVVTALNFAKKIRDTGECDVLILDEIISAAERKYITEEIICDLLEHKPSSMDIILTGCVLLDCIAEKADNIYYIVNEKKAN